MKKIIITGARSGIINKVIDKIENDKITSFILETLNEVGEKIWKREKKNLVQNIN